MQNTTTTTTSTKLSKTQLFIREWTNRLRRSSSSKLELENYFTTTFNFNNADSE